MPGEFQEEDRRLDGEVYRNINGKLRAERRVSKIFVCLDTPSASFVIISAYEVVIRVDPSDEQWQPLGQAALPQYLGFSTAEALRARSNEFLSRKYSELCELCRFTRTETQTEEEIPTLFGHYSHPKRRS
jgi:hypothetical protein